VSVIKLRAPFHVDAGTQDSGELLGSPLAPVPWQQRQLARTMGPILQMGMVRLREADTNPSQSGGMGVECRMKMKAPALGGVGGECRVV
jgi:hypothetical protein